MIRKISYMALLALYLQGLISPDLLAQDSPFDPEMSTRAALIKEEVNGFTDRSFYITGEAVKFIMRVQTSGLDDKRDWSRILYMELISASGIRRAQGKFRINNGMATGELRIPEGILTGVYCLRAYTRWMRNQGPASYAYLPLRIINPFDSELDKAPANEQEEYSLGTLSLDEGEVKISTGSFSHGRGDSILVELVHIPGADSQGVNGCLSIVPASARPGSPMQLINIGREEPDFQLDFLPDLFGISLSGLVQVSAQEQVLAGSRIHFTLLGEQPGYAVAHADAYGRFSLSLPGREGRLELFVQPEQAGTGTMEVRIDQDFDGRVLPLDLPSFSLNQKEKQELILMARKHQLSGIFADTTAGEMHGEVLPKVPIYGTPDFRLVLDDFVLLPTLEEVFINLVPDVTPLIRRNRTELTIASVNPAISLFPPLVMIDQVPIFSLDKFLSISPTKISHIDVVNDVYLRGDLRFGGVINLWSLEGNMAGIDLPEQSFFIDYHALTPLPDTPLEKHISADHLPDTRNTLLWLPELKLERSISRSFSFIAPDYPGEYLISYRGWDEQGRPVISESLISIE